MIKAIFQRWFFCTISILAALIAALGMLQSLRNRDALGFVVSFVLFIADGVCARSLWPGEEREDVTQPTNPSPTAMIPMPTVHLDHVDLLMSTPYADVMDAWLRAAQRGEMQEKLRGNDEDGDGVEV